MSDEGFDSGGDSNGDMSSDVGSDLGGNFGGDFGGDLASDDGADLGGDMDTDMGSDMDVDTSAAMDTDLCSDDLGDDLNDDSGESIDDGTDFNADTGTNDDLSEDLNWDTDVGDGIDDNISDDLDTSENLDDAPTDDVSEDATDTPTDIVTADRREIMDNVFNNAPDNIKDIVSDYNDNLNVENTEGDDCCHYDPNVSTIRMEDSMADDEYAEVYTHEYGHFADDQMDWPSESDEFINAVESDRGLYGRGTDEGRERFDNMLNDAFSSGAAYDRMVSDNLSALFQNDMEIKARFANEGVPFYGHSDDYWNNGLNRENEIFANNFSIQANNDAVSMAFLNNHMPNSTASFNNLISTRGR